MPLASTPLASANRASIRYVEENQFGVIPTGVGNEPTALRFTGESLAIAVTKDSSKELRADRLVADLIPTSVQASGGVNFEFSYGEYDPFLQAVLGGTWDMFGIAGNGLVGVADIDSVTGKITAAVAPAGASALTKLKVGQWFRLKAAGDAADGAFVMVKNVTSTVVTVDPSTPIPGVGVRAAVAAVSISSARLTDGTVNRTFTIERSFDDVGQFFVYRGMGTSKMDLSFDSAALLTGTVDFMGKNSTRDVATFLNGAVNPSQTFDVLNTVTGVGKVYENGEPLTGTFVKSIKLSVDGKLRALPALGEYGAARINQGTLEITGTAEIYLADGTLYDKFIDNLSTSLSFGVRDGNQRGYQFTLPRIKFSDAKVQAGGLDQDAMLSIPFKALYDPVTKHAILVDRFSV